MLIGVTGKKRRGKDTFSNRFVENFGFKRYGFADKVKAVALGIDPLIAVDYDLVDSLGLVDTPPEFELSGGLGYVYRLSVIIEEIGIESAKEIPEVRRTYQRVGTEGGREVYRPTFWIDELFKQLYEDNGYELGDKYNGHREGFDTNIIISDVRFDNEAQRIKSHKGLIIQVESSREGLPHEDSHASEVEISSSLVDIHIFNDGTLKQFIDAVDLLAKYELLLLETHNEII
jgi:hypothetical protein